MNAHAAIRFVHSVIHGLEAHSGQQSIADGHLCWARGYGDSHHLGHLPCPTTLQHIENLVFPGLHIVPLLTESDWHHDAGVVVVWNLWPATGNGAVVDG